MARPSSGSAFCGFSPFAAPKSVIAKFVLVAALVDQGASIQGLRIVGIERRRRD